MKVNEIISVLKEAKETSDVAGRRDQSLAERGCGQRLGWNQPTELEPRSTSGERKSWGSQQELTWDSGKWKFLQGMKPGSDWVLNVRLPAQRQHLL